MKSIIRKLVCSKTINVAVLLTVVQLTASLAILSTVAIAADRRGEASLGETRFGEEDSVQIGYCIPMDASDFSDAGALITFLGDQNTRELHFATVGLAGDLQYASASGNLSEDLIYDSAPFVLKGVGYAPVGYTLERTGFVYNRGFRGKLYVTHAVYKKKNCEVEVRCILDNLPF